MPIYTDDPCNDGVIPFGTPLVSSIGINPKVTKAIDAATRNWLDEHPEATTTVEDYSVTTSKIADNAVTADKISSDAVDGLRIMTTMQPGVAKVGPGLTINNGALELDGDGDIATAVSSWLNAHPEATTTVQDNSLSFSKLDSDLKSLVENGREVISGWQDGYIDVGSRTNLSDVISTPVSSTSLQYVVLTCNPYEMFELYIRGGTAPASFAFTDSSYNVLAVSHTTYSNGLVYRSPVDAAYLVLTRYKSTALDSYRGEAITHENAYGLSSLYSLFGVRPIGKWFNGYIDTSENNVRTAANSPVINSLWRNAIVDCLEGDLFTISASTGTLPNAYVFVDESWNVIYRDSGNPRNMLIVAPNGAKHLIINVSSSVSMISYFGDATSFLKNETEIDKVIPGKTNMIWSWWVYPQVISYHGARDKLYWTFTGNDGYAGIACYDLRDHTTYKKILKSGSVDDHNSIAMTILNDGTILCAYATGHNDDSRMHVRRSTLPENIERFDPAIDLSSTGGTSYCQLLHDSNKLFMFYRSASTSWCYRYSTDDGVTWSDEVILIVANLQYYCKFTPTTTNGIIRILMYSNPTLSDSNIRQGFLDTNTLDVYNSDNLTLLGNNNISNTSFTIIIPNEETLNHQRMFDVAITEPNRPLVLYAPFSSGNDNVYKIYDSGVITTIITGGTGLIPSYQLGMAWIGTDKIVVAHSSGSGGGKDLIRLYSYENGAVTLIETIWDESRSVVRNGRPIVDINNEALLWHRGKYSTYRIFDTDAMIYVINE